MEVIASMEPDILKVDTHDCAIRLILGEDEVEEEKRHAEEDYERIVLQPPGHRSCIKHNVNMLRHAKHCKETGCWAGKACADAKIIYNAIKMHRESCNDDKFTATQYTKTGCRVCQLYSWLDETTPAEDNFEATEALCAFAEDEFKCSDLAHYNAGVDVMAYDVHDALEVHCQRNRHTFSHSGMMLSGTVHHMLESWLFGKGGWKTTMFDEAQEQLFDKHGKTRPRVLTLSGIRFFNR